MVVKRTEGLIEKIESLYMDDIELIVAAANIAGYMENAGKLYIEDDAELAKFCVNIVERYYRETDVDNAFPEFVGEALSERFPVE